MNKIKVFIVDDSATVRTVVGDILNAATGIEVIGSASDPIFAMPHLERHWPDVIVLDIEMPRMDGLTFLGKIMGQRPTPVVMCSTLTENGSAASIKALAKGAVEIVAKPKVNLKSGLEDSARMLVNAVRAASKVNLKVLSGPRAAPTPVPAAPKLSADAMLARGGPTSSGGGDLIAIGTSTGGTQALERILPRLGADAAPIVLVQHMPEKFTAAFAERLNGLCAVEVREARDGDPVKVGQVLIAPGGQHMMAERNGFGMRVRVKDGPLVSRHRPSVDVLFRSVAKVSGKRALGIIMTGMGDDGANGLKEMHDAGAFTLAQDAETCVIHGMPAVAVKRGGVDREVPLDALATEIMGFGRSS